MQCTMAMLNFGTVRYCNLVSEKQKNVYINASSDVGSIFSWGGYTKGAVSIQIISGTCNWGFAKLLELLSLTNLQVNIGEGQKKVFPHFTSIISSNFGLF